VQSSPALKFGIAFNEASPGYEAMPGGPWGREGRVDDPPTLKFQDCTTCLGVFSLKRQ